MDKGIVIWFTGLPSSGKTTIANATANLLMARGKKVKILDGDALRNTISKDLGYTDNDRATHIARVADLAYTCAKNGYIVLASLITPLDTHRSIVKDYLGGYYHLCFVKCNIMECIKRDVKGLYQKAIAGKIDNFTGISADYDEPKQYDIVCHTEDETILESSKKVLNYISSFNI
jgi:adenylylsulfate kinase